MIARNTMAVPVDSCSPPSLVLDLHHHWIARNTTAVPVDNCSLPSLVLDLHHHRITYVSLST